MNVLDLFSGIGGFSLGLERAGMRTVAFCEIEPFCRSVLEERWPGIPLLGDIRTVGPQQIAALEPIDVICGGFPCQDISVAGRSAGLAGADSGLWFEYARLIRQVRPDWVVIENSPRLRTLGADRVLSDLEESAYACWPIVVGAVHAGSPQIRKRAFVIAHAKSDGRGSRGARRPPAGVEGLQNHSHRDDASDLHRFELRQQSGRRDGPCWPETVVPPIADTWEDGPFDGEQVDDGLPEDVDAAIKAYGNAVLPQLTELIGRAIMKCAHTSSTEPTK